MFFILFFYIFFNTLVNSYDEIEDKIFFQKNSWEYVKNSMTSGSLNGYYTIDQLNQLLISYKTNFPEIIQELRIIGSTYNSQPIYAMLLSKKNLDSDYINYSSLNNTSNIKKSDDFSINYQSKRQSTNLNYNDKSILLLTSGFSGSHFSSISMSVYLIKYFIYNYVNNDDLTHYLLENRKIWFIPLLNVDGYTYITNKFLKSYIFYEIIKNRRIFNQCDLIDNMGVNLLFNYDFKFASNSNLDKCEINYKGEFSFSESETNAHNIFTNFINPLILINFVGFRNGIFMPFNSFGDESIDSFSKDPLFQKFNEFENKNVMPINSFFGLLYQFSGEIRSGDPSDYFYHTKNIFSLNVEVGDKNIESGLPFPKKENLLNILDNYLNYSLFLMLKGGEYFEWVVDSQIIEECNQDHLNILNCNNNELIYGLRVSLTNTGLDNSKIIRSFEFNTGKYIRLEKNFIQREISNYNLFDDYLNFEQIYTEYVGVNQNLENIYRIYIPPLKKNQSFYFVAIGMIIDYEIAYKTKISFSDTAFIDSQIFSKFIFNIEEISSKLKVINEKTQIEDNLQNYPRKSSIILIIIYFSLVIFILLIRAFKKL